VIAPFEKDINVNAIALGTHLHLKEASQRNFRDVLEFISTQHKRV
jgi:hypothetical protein